LELRIDELKNFSELNPATGLMEFILDKNTNFNLENGSVYSLDYDLKVEWKPVSTHNRTVALEAWRVQYIGMDEKNSMSRMKQPYVIHRVTDVWLCIMLNGIGEYERQEYTVVNNMTNGVPNEDTVIKSVHHICGFDIKYIDGKGKEHWLDHQTQIVPINVRVDHFDPYVHYIMDDPQTLRLQWQLQGRRRFVPELNSEFEITLYFCRGDAANFDTYKQEVQPRVMTKTNRYPNNAAVMKAAFVASPSFGGTDIATVEMTRRETIEAYNTAHAITSDNDILQWFKTFHFAGLMYPFFMKRRDDPWGRVWSCYLALHDKEDDHVYRTNTLHWHIRWDVLYNNNDNTMSENEIIIPPGWISVYRKGDRFTVIPYTHQNLKTVETARTVASVDSKYIFANPFGIRIQKEPFAIGYFNPWIHESYIASHIPKIFNDSTDIISEDVTIIYSAFPLITNIKRTYKDNYYLFTSYIVPTIAGWTDGSELIKYIRQNVMPLLFPDILWQYFKRPMDEFATSIPMLSLAHEDTFIPFNPDLTYLCVKFGDTFDNKIEFLEMWMEDFTDNPDGEKIMIPISGEISRFLGDLKIWGNKDLLNRYARFTSGYTEIYLHPSVGGPHSNLLFERIDHFNYYEMRLSNSADRYIDHIKIPAEQLVQSHETKYGEQTLWLIGRPFSPRSGIKVHWDNEHEGVYQDYWISNAARVYIPFDPDEDMYDLDGKLVGDENGDVIFSFGRSFGRGWVILYADMRPEATDGKVDYYRLPLSSFAKDQPVFFIENNMLPYEKNHMRVLLHVFNHGAETGRIEMQPVRLNDDGSYQFEAKAYPINELVDIDNNINIASTTEYGGSWVPKIPDTRVSMNASDPHIQISILIRTEDHTKDSEIEIGDSFTGFRIIDQYRLDDVTLIQELKQMRSIVHFDNPLRPTLDEISLYKRFLELWETTLNEARINTIWNYASNEINQLTQLLPRYAINNAAQMLENQLDSLIEEMKEMVRGFNGNVRQWVSPFDIIKRTLHDLYDEDRRIQPVEPIGITIESGIVKTAFNGTLLEDKETAATYRISNEFTIGDLNINKSWIATHILREASSEDENDAIILRIEREIMEGYFHDDYRIFKGWKDEEAREGLHDIGKWFVSFESLGGMQQFSFDNVNWGDLEWPDGEDIDIPSTSLLVHINNEVWDEMVFEQNEINNNIPVNWNHTRDNLGKYCQIVTKLFDQRNVNGGVEIQQVPFVKKSLMMEDRFESFISSMTRIHRAIEPVIFHRLEGNNFLDTKLIATYGLPHSYSADVDVEVEDRFWPDLRIQIEFDVRLYNKSLSTNTVAELKTIIKDYFGRITTVHTPLDLVDMNDNIYVSHIIDRMEDNGNVAYLKFKGWYTNERGMINGNFMDSNIQSIERKWEEIEDFPVDINGRSKLESFVPEMFVLEDHDIIINILD